MTVSWVSLGQLRLSPLHVRTSRRVNARVVLGSSQRIGFCCITIITGKAGEPAQLRTSHE